MTPDRLQVPPRASGASQILTGAPLAKRHLHQAAVREVAERPAVRRPERLLCAFGAGTADASSLSRARTKRRVPDASVAVKAIERLSGETTGAESSSRPAGSDQVNRATPMAAGSCVGIGPPQSPRDEASDHGARGERRRGRSEPRARSLDRPRPGGGFQGEGDVPRRLEALLGSLLEAAPHHPLEPGRNVRLRQLRWVLLEDRRHQLGRGLARKRPPPREHLVEHRAEGEDVGPMVGGLSPDLLGRHVADGAEHDARPGRGGDGRALGARSAGSSVGRSLARPKSRILTRPSLVTNRFSGFRSRCTIPFSCAAARPCAIWTA